MLKDIISLCLLFAFILAILNIIKTIFQYIPIIRHNLKYNPTNREIFLLGASIAYTIAFIIQKINI